MPRCGAGERSVVLTAVSKAIAAIVDVVAVLVFVAIGLSVHAHGITVGEMASVAGPFLAGTAVGWALARGRNVTRLWPTGVVVWLSTVVVGMLIRDLAGQGFDGAFVVVASLFLALELLGWRLIAQVATAIGSRGSRSRPASARG